MSLVFVNAQELASVVSLACLTEHRDNAEQRALLAVAERLDKVLNREAARAAIKDHTLEVRDGEFFGTMPPASTYERLVHESRVLEDGQHPVRTSWERKGRPERTGAAT